jgi:hypothetical protein
MRSAVVLLLSMSLMGCHARFKKAVGSIDTANVDLVVVGGPQVQLGYMYSGVDLLDAVVNITQEVKSAKQTKRIASVVDIHQVNDQMYGGTADGLETGPPFAYRPDGTDADALVQIEVMSWGMDVPILGAPGVFTYDMRVRIYEDSGRRVYKGRLMCDTSVGAPPALSQALWTVNNVKQLDSLSDEEVQAAFDATAAWCGQQLVTQLRRHGG